MIDLILQRFRLPVHFAPNLFVVVTRDDVSSPGRCSQAHNDDATQSNRLASPRHRRIVTVQKSATIREAANRAFCSDFPA
jgi:hypothetical protein